MRVAEGPLQTDGDHATQIALHTDVFVDLTASVGKFAGSSGFLDEHVTAMESGKVTATTVGCDWLILL